MAVIGSSNVSVQSIGSVLNEAGGSVNINQPLTFFTESAKINKWALHKPFIYPQDFFETTADYLVAAKKKNFGLTIPTSALGSGISSEGWTYALPTGGSTQPMRIGDFRLYNTNAPCPMKVTWANESTEAYINTINSASLPYIRVWYRLDENTSSPGMGNAEITLNDVNISGVSTNTIGGYVACVVAYSSTLGAGAAAYRIANAEDTLDLRFGTAIADYVINLNKFNIEEAATTAIGGNFPEGAINKRMLKLYPKINKYTPSEKGKVYSTTSDNPTTAPTTTSGGNGYVSANVGNQFISVPNGGVLTLYMYERVTVQINYGYTSITNGTTTLIGTWGFVDSSSSYTNGVFSLGGKTINYNTQQVTVRTLCTLHNIDETADAIVTSQFLSDARGIFPKRVVTMQDSSGNSITSNQVTIPKGGSINVYFVATYTAGSASNYTFASLTSPSYGTSTPRISLKAMTSNGWGAEFTPPQYNDLNKELRWR